MNLPIKELDFDNFLRTLTDNKKTHKPCRLAGFFVLPWTAINFNWCHGANRTRDTWIMNPGFMQIPKNIYKYLSRYSLYLSLKFPPEVVLFNIK